MVSSNADRGGVRRGSTVDYERVVSVEIAHRNERASVWQRGRDGSFRRWSDLAERRRARPFEGRGARDEPVGVFHASRLLATDGRCELVALGEQPSRLRKLRMSEKLLLDFGEQDERPLLVE
jgi:hypothetical protein